MAEIYSTYAAKAKFSEVLRKVRAGKRVTVSHRGKPIAEIVPIQAPKTIEERLEELRERGVLSPHREPTGPLKPIADIPGVLERFLKERD